MVARLLLLSCCGLLLSAGLHADDPTKQPELLVKEITAPARNVDGPRGNVRKPTEIMTADQLAKVFSDKEAVAKVQKDVDFAKQKLVYFAWAGSGQDRLRATISEAKDGKEVVFLFRPGRTKDLRQHAHLFAVDKKVQWRVGDDTGGN